MRNATATINFELTNYAQGLVPDIQNANDIASVLCPVVQVPGANGQYKSFNDRNMFTAYATARGLGGSARRLEFLATDGSFNCTPHALEATVDDAERLAAGDSPLAQQLLDQGKVRAVVNSVAMSRADRIVTYVLSKLTAVANRGNWSNADVDPIDQLDELITNLATDVGTTQGITLVLGLNALRLIRGNANVKKRAQGVQVSSLTPEQLSGILIAPIRVVVGVVSKASNNIGQATVTKANVVGDNAILTYSAANPSIYDPSAFKCFTTGVNQVASVRTYRDEGARSDVHAIDWSEDLQQTSTLAAKRLAIT